MSETNWYIHNESYPQQQGEATMTQSNKKKTYSELLSELDQCIDEINNCIERYYGFSTAPKKPASCAVEALPKFPSEDKVTEYSVSGKGVLSDNTPPIFGEGLSPKERETAFIEYFILNGRFPD